MTLIAYKEHNFKQASLDQIDQAQVIIEEYELDGYTLTLRQLYYQFVSRDLIPNTNRSYKNLGKLVSNARLAGRLSWSAIEDRSRGHTAWRSQEDEREVLNGIEYGLTINRWARMSSYVEVWIEKEALSNVIEKPCRYWHVPYMACKGFLSSSEAWRAGRRFKSARDAGYKPILIHLGDHDPSGIDMTRDCHDRLLTFSGSQDIEVRRIALNMAQVDEYSPPPNPAKETDSRYSGYQAQFGNQCWELDALEPSVINQLVEDQIKSIIDMDVWEACEKEQAEKRGCLASIYDRWPQVKSFLEGNPDE